jgi:hypothetical protein
VEDITEVVAVVVLAVPELLTVMVNITEVVAVVVENITEFLAVLV